MAITNAQQYKQLLAQGGRIGLQGGGRDSGKDKGLGDREGRDNREIGQRAARTRAAADANQRTLAALGDPDPEVDVDTKDRKDTITKFGKNLYYNLKSNPFSMLTPLGTLLKTSFQTNKAQKMMGMPGFDYTDDDDDTGNGDRLPIILPPLMAQAPSITDQETETEVEEEEPFEMSRRFRAEGGIMNTDVVGGEMDFDSARQMYGLGKLVKKITRSVKKVAKSPIGKAALLGIGAYGLGGGTFFGKMLPGVTRGGQGFGGFGGLSSIFGNVGDIIGGTGLGDKFAKAAGSKIGLGIAGASLVAGMLTPKQEEEAQQISDETGIDIAEIRANPNKYLARRFRAEGGSMDEPVAKKTMPLLDMDGQEMDLRAEGGFVPLGRMEKADDVPARLSKNEFVFTADAVRNAGEGDVDKGAEVMYNMMKNLESGGDVSEESQGLDGAREMFQTSQRLEEVI